MNQTKIDYVDASWNPVTGCTDELPCWSYCWARKMATRLRGRCGYDAMEPFKPTFHRDRLVEPAGMKKSRRIAVCFMGDLWHTGVKVADRAAVIRATNLAPQHTYLFLTKRVERAAEEINWLASPNLWIGTSIANQREANKRVYHLLRCEALHRWLSIEPMNGPIDLHGGPVPKWWNWNGGIDWVVLGGGPFPIHPRWVRLVRDQCQAAGVAFWFKQWGNFTAMGTRVGKKAAGNLLDGREWHEVPKGI